jgi:hypothetical protein
VSLVVRVRPQNVTLLRVPPLTEGGSTAIPDPSSGGHPPAQRRPMTLPVAPEPGARGRRPLRWHVCEGLIRDPGSAGVSPAAIAPLGARPHPEPAEGSSGASPEVIAEGEFRTPLPTCRRPSSTMTVRYRRSIAGKGPGGSSGPGIAQFPNPLAALEAPGTPETAEDCGRLWKIALLGARVSGLDSPAAKRRAKSRSALACRCRRDARAPGHQRSPVLTIAHASVAGQNGAAIPTLE